MKCIERRFEPIDIGVVDHRHTRNAQLAAEIEQIVLDLGQQFADRGRRDREASTKPMRAVEFIDGAVGGDARESLATRVPSPRPVVPSSPVRV